MAEAEIKSGNTVELCSDSAYSINCIRNWAPNWEKKGWKNLTARSRTWKLSVPVTRSTDALKKELNLSHVTAHVGTEGNELADRMAMLGVQREEGPTASVSGNHGCSDTAEDAGGVINKRCSLKGSSLC